jgi:multiple sugar transport system substrate-binding protein
MKWKVLQIKRNTGPMWVIVLALCFAVLTGCNNSDNANSSVDEAGNPSAPNETSEMKPVTLKILPNGTSKNEQFFQEIIINSVKAKYPQITLETYNIDPGQDIYERILASGDVPDIMGDWQGALINLQALGLPEDLNPYVKKYNADLSRFTPQILDAMRSPDGKLMALPYAVNFNTIYVNKDIFDKFGLPYPKDGMTWDETVDLARKLTRTTDGIEYKGLSYDGTLARILMPMGLTSGIDTKANKSVANSEPYKKAFDLAFRINSIPGNAPDPGGQRNNFLKKRNIAMLSTVGVVTLDLIAGKGDSMSGT